jgi:hypothetical protein
MWKTKQSNFHCKGVRQSLSEFEKLTQNFTAEGFDENKAKDKAF